MFVALLGSSRDDIPLHTSMVVGEVIQSLSETDYSFVLGGASGGIMQNAYEHFLEAGNEMVVMQSQYRNRNSIFVNPSFVAPCKDAFDRTRGIFEASDTLVFFPGGDGTYAEFFSVLEYQKETGQSIPIFIYNETGEYTPLLELEKKQIHSNYVERNVTLLYKEVTSKEELLKELSIIEEKKRHKIR